jgi:hypothetical protein
MGFERRHWVLAFAAIGFAVAALFAGLWLGGGFDLGRRDAALAIPSLLAFAIIFVVLAPVKGRVVVAAGTLAMAALLLPAAWWQGAAPGSIANGLILLGATAAALTLAAALWQWVGRWRWWLGWLTALKAAALWWFAGHVLLGQLYQPAVGEAAEGATGRNVVLSALPLRQMSLADVRGGGEDAALRALRRLLPRRTELRDVLAPGELAAGDRLLLAHPAALPPASLVEIDRFVRSGGRAVVLADGLSGWPPPHGFGDPRNPPVTSLLTPLLGHWGIDLAAPLPGSEAADQVAVFAGGSRLLLHSAGHFTLLPTGCQVMATLPGGAAAIAECRIGKGQAILVSDADLLFAPLWQSAPGWARHLRPADNIEWLAEQIEGEGAGPAWGLRPIWNR